MVNKVLIDGKIIYKKMIIVKKMKVGLVGSGKVVIEYARVIKSNHDIHV